MGFGKKCFFYFFKDQTTYRLENNNPWLQQMIYEWINNFVYKKVIKNLQDVSSEEDSN